MCAQLQGRLRSVRCHAHAQRNSYLRDVRPTQGPRARVGQKIKLLQVEAPVLRGQLLLGIDIEVSIVFYLYPGIGTSSTVLNTTIDI